MKDDKKKLLVLGVLVLVMLAVGAFTFLGGKKSAPVATTATTDEGTTVVDDAENAEVTEEEDPNGLRPELSGMIASTYSPRDPFEIPSGADLRGTKPQPKPEPEQPKTQNRPATHTQQTPPLNPLGLGGNLPSLGDSGPGLPIIPAGPTYKVKGILIGKKSIVVFEDEGGNQKLVPIGGSVDGDTKVTNIEKGKVTVIHKGEKKTLTLEEEANK